jgi:voltage-gated potassium channel
MKALSALLATFLRGSSRQNLRILLKFVLFLAGLIALYTILFHLLMQREGQSHSWLSGLYWVLVVMTTLGFGDITFQSDLGRVFSVLVLVSGVFSLLVILPFTFIQFFYAPWMEAQARSRAPRTLSEDIRDHVILTRHDALTLSLIQRLDFYDRRYVVLEPELSRALELHDLGVSVVLGDSDDPETYRRLRADRAALVVAGMDDYDNTNIAFTVREISESVPIVSIARDGDSVDIQQLAGATHVLQLTEMLGRSLARRTLGGETRANVIGQFEQMLIAESPVMGTPLAGKSLAESRLREVTGLTVVGVWERGRFLLPEPNTIIQQTHVLVLAGTEENLARFDQLVCIYNVADAPVIILGGGRVGRAAALCLAERDVPYRIVERRPELVKDDEHYILGSAADLSVLERAGIRDALTTMVTTNDDATNIYLTIYCRRLRPDMQIISRATLERNVSTLHRAGADFVMSYASMGADAIFNILEHNDVLMLAEGLDVFRYRAPDRVVGRTLAESRIRETTGCSVIAIETSEGTTINPDPGVRIAASAELILIGTTEGERLFMEKFVGIRRIRERERERQQRRIAPTSPSRPPVITP